MKRKKCSHVVVVFYFILVQSKFALNISLPFFFDLLTMHSSQTIQSNEKKRIIDDFCPPQISMSYYFSLFFV